MDTQKQIILTDSGIENLGFDVKEVTLVNDETIIIGAKYNKQNLSILYTYESNGMEIGKINSGNNVASVEYVEKNVIEEYFN